MVEYTDRLQTLACQNHRHGITHEITPVAMKIVQVMEKDGTIVESYSCPRCFQIIPATKELKEKVATMTEALEEEARKHAEASIAEALLAEEKLKTEAEVTPEGTPKTLGIVATEQTKVDAAFGQFKK